MQNDDAFNERAQGIAFRNFDNVGKRDTTMTNTDTQAAATKTKLSPLQSLQAELKKKSAVFVVASDEQADFGELLGTFQEDELEDWTIGAPESFDTLAITQPENGKARLVSIADMDTALNDPAVRKWAYNRYVSRCVNVAKSDEATKDQFRTPAGPIGAAYDMSAFDFQVEIWLDWLHDQGLKSVRQRSLRTALSNAATAASSFPKVAQEGWVALIGRMSARAEKHGHDTSIFQHWLATRDLQRDTGMPIEFNFTDDPETADEAAETADATEGATS